MSSQRRDSTNHDPCRPGQVWTVYYHSPCFDGIASAVLAMSFLETVWLADKVTLSGVNYHLKPDWLATRLSSPCAVIDFLYHPAATFWADHHRTTFLTKESEADYRKRRQSSEKVFYDREAPSCALLLWQYLSDTFRYQPSRYDDLVRWATVTDAAQYQNVEQAIHPRDPALVINSTLSIDKRSRYSDWLVQTLKVHSLSEVAETRVVRHRFEKVDRLTCLGLRRMENSIRLESSNIATFDVDSRDVVINRYSPYHFYSDARYSIGIVRNDQYVRVTAMRNPWLDFESVPLGLLFQKFGGGGHARVASVVLQAGRSHEAHNILQTLIAEITSAELTHD